MKTPEEMAEEYASEYVSDAGYILSKDAFLAGYKAAQDECADAGKVMPKQDEDLLHKVANDYLDMKAAKYRRVCGYKK